MIKIVIEKRMPDESCRMCGGELAKCTVCAECRKPVSMICVRCGTRTMAQVHDICFSCEPRKTDQISPLGNGIFLKQALVA